MTLTVALMITIFIAFWLGYDIGTERMRNAEEEMDARIEDAEFRAYTDGYRSALVNAAAETVALNEAVEKGFES